MSKYKIAFNILINELLPRLKKHNLEKQQLALVVSPSELAFLVLCEEFKYTTRKDTRIIIDKAFNRYLEC